MKAEKLPRQELTSEELIDRAAEGLARLFVMSIDERESDEQTTNGI